MSDAWQVQKAIFTALSGDVTLMGMVNAVCDVPPENIQPPYVTFNYTYSDDAGGKTFVATDHRVFIDVWSRKAGYQEAYTIIDRIKTLLHEQSLSLTGYALVLLRYMNSRVILDEDGRTVHGIIELRALTQDT